MASNETVKICSFFDYEIKSHLKQKRKLAAFINDLIFHYKNKGSQIDYTFVNDEFLLQMNQTHLKHDTYTDIITFDLTEKKSDVIIVDIYISIDRVKENAAHFDIKYQDELLRVIIHGALHISGFGDKTTKQKAQMRLLENEWMNKFQSQE